MVKEYSSDSTGLIVVKDDEYPYVIGKGRIAADADQDFERIANTTWHPKRVAEIQLILDKVLEWDGITRDEYMQLQNLVDDFIGKLRETKPGEYW